MNTPSYSRKQTKENQQNPPLQNKMKKKKSNKWTLKPQPRLCLLVSYTHIPSAQQGLGRAAVESGTWPQPSPGLAKVCAFWREQECKRAGHEKVCRQKVLNKLCFLLLLLLLSALSVCVAGVQRKSQTNSDAFPCSVWAKSEKALMAAFVEGLQYRLIL